MFGAFTQGEHHCAWRQCSNVGAKYVVPSLFSSPFLCGITSFEIGSITKIVIKFPQMFKNALFDGIGCVKKYSKIESVFRIVLKMRLEYYRFSR